MLSSFGSPRILGGGGVSGCGMVDGGGGAVGCDVCTFGGTGSSCVLDACDSVGFFCSSGFFCLLECLMAEY